MSIQKQYIKIKKPDINTLCSVFKTVLSHNKEWNTKISLLSKDRKYVGKLETMQFPAVFPNSYMGDDVDEYGVVKSPDNVFTPGIVTVIKDVGSDFVGVFFGFKLSYIMSEPSMQFYLDTKKKQISTKSKAFSTYKPEYISYKSF